MNRSISKALVTGATGFIGQNMVRALLQRNIQVRCLVRNPDTIDPQTKKLDAEWVRGDVRNYASLREATAGVDTVFHLAGETRALNRQEMIQTNGKGTANLAHACAACDTPPVLVCVSSISAAGPSCLGVPKIESETPEPVSDYGRSKLMAEKGAALWAAEVPTTIVRPGLVFGERDRELLPAFYSIDRFRFHFYPNYRSPKLSLIYVQDLVQLLIRAAETGERVPPPSTEATKSPGQGYYFACTHGYPSYADLGRMLASALGRSVALIPLLTPVPWLVGFVSELQSHLSGRKSTVTRDKIREANVASWACSSAKAQLQLGFNPQSSLLETLHSTAQWYRDQHWL